MRRALAYTFVLTLLWPASTLAQDAPSLDEFSAMRFFPAPGPGNYLHVDGSAVGGHLVPSVGLLLDWSHRPFTLFNASCARDDDTNCEVEDVNTPLLRFIFAGHVHGSVAIADRLQVGLALPLAWARGEGFEYTPPGATSPVIINNGEGNVWNKFAVGDPRLSLKVRILGESGEDGIGMAVVGWASAPVGSLTAENRFVGESTLTAGGHFVAQFRRERFHLAGNVGGIYRPTQLLFSTEVGSQLTWAGAIGYDLTSLLTVFGEIQGASSFTAQVDENPMEARLAGRLRHGDLSFELAAGGGIVSGVGVPLFRVVGGARWAPVRTDSDGDGILDSDDACPSEMEDFDDWLDDDGCPEADNDSDGFDDDADRCPNDPEDRDQHEDEDGCPDPDNDGDGVNDGYDSCPSEPEDMDGDRDEDGCPDDDRDRDGVPDDIDQCPDEEEDTDGYGDEDGCPETDFDGDGVPDDVDECPDQAEVINGVADTDGCPEQDQDGDGIPDEADACPAQPETLNGRADDDGCPDGQALVEVQGEEIKLLQQVLFRTNSSAIRGAQSFRILDAVATILSRNPSYRRVRIEGHTDSRGDAERNRTLSRDRAQACIDYLVERKGLSAERFYAEGFGADRPIGDNETRDGRAANRRTEFHIIPVTPGAPAGGAAPAAPTEPEAVPANE